MLARGIHDGLVVGIPDPKNVIIILVVTIASWVGGRPKGIHTLTETPQIKMAQGER